MDKRFLLENDSEIPYPEFWQFKRKEESQRPLKPTAERQAIKVIEMTYAYGFKELLSLLFVKGVSFLGVIAIPLLPFELPHIRLAQAKNRISERPDAKLTIEQIDGLSTYVIDLHRPNVPNELRIVP